MTALSFLLLFVQVHTLDRSRLSEFQKAQIRDAADTYWREVQGTNYWLAPLVSWEMGHRDRRPLTNWTRIIGTPIRDGKNVIVIQELGRQPTHLVLTNLPPEKIVRNRVNSYALARGKVSVTLNSRPVLLPLYDFGKVIKPPVEKKLLLHTNTPAANPAPTKDFFPGAKRDSIKLK